MPHPLLPPESEDDFQRAVIGLAKLHRWRTAHFRPLMTAKGLWRTAVQGDGRGFPDLILVRGKRMIAAELKSEKGTLSAEQEEWLEALRENIEVYCWRPSNWTEIEDILS